MCQRQLAPAQDCQDSEICEAVGSWSFAVVAVFVPQKLANTEIRVPYPPTSPYRDLGPKEKVLHIAVWPHLTSLNLL